MLNFSLEISIKDLLPTGFSGPGIGEISYDVSLINKLRGKLKFSHAYFSCTLNAITVNMSSI